MKRLLAALSLASAMLGFGTYVAALEVAWSRAASDAAAGVGWRQTDELRRPICRRNNFANLERPLVRTGQNCP